MAPHQRRCLARPLHLTAGRRGVGRVAGSRDSERARVERVHEKHRAARSQGTAGSSAPLLLTCRAEAEPQSPSRVPFTRRGGWEGGPGAGPVMGGAPPGCGRCGDSAPDPGSQTVLSRSRPPGAGSAATPGRRHCLPRAARAASHSVPAGSHSGCSAQSLRPAAGVVLGGG